MSLNDSFEYSLGKREEVGLNKFSLIHLECCEKTLLTNFPPKFFSKNKKNLWQEIKEKFISDEEESRNFVGGNETVSFDRYKSFHLPIQISHQFETELEQTMEPFRYLKTEDGYSQWYFNFADARLFGYYSGSLFAQDEHQVMEHPLLGSIKELLGSKTHNELNKHAYTVKESSATPVLVSNVRRHAYIETLIDKSRGIKKSLYGNNFSCLPFDDIMNATIILTPSNAEKHKLDTHSNILCLEAPKGRGTYSRTQIRYTLEAAYSGFRACRLQTPSEKKVVIHTGNWGCGAFGGNGELMAILQICAARIAGVDKLVYHTFDDEFTTRYNDGTSTLNQLWPKKSQEKSLSSFIDDIYELEFKWGIPNGT